MSESFQLRDSRSRTAQVAGKALDHVYFLLLLAASCLAYYFTIPAEDAVILFEYAKNLAERGMITYGGAPTPIEGATDFLWMVTIGLLKHLGVDEFASALAFNFLGGVAIYRMARSLGMPALVAASGVLAMPYLFSSLYGFSTLSFAAIYAGCLYLLLHRKAGLYLALLVLCLVRPDGVVWGIGVVALRLLEARTEGRLQVEAGRLFWQLVIPGVTYFAWRLWYFGEILPLPFLVKASGERDLLFFYRESMEAIGYALEPVLLSILFVRDRRRFAGRLLLLFLVPVFFYAAMRLEQNIGNRFLAPMFFGALVLLAAERSILAGLAFVLASILLAQKITLDTLLLMANSRNENIYYISRDLSALNGKMLVTEAGRLAYYSNWLAHDSWGLNTPEYAHELVDRGDLERGRYDLIVGHCDLAQLDAGRREAKTAPTRTWDNQCEVLMGYVGSSDYDLFLVPFVRIDGIPVLRGLKYELKTLLGIPAVKPVARAGKCRRHDVYAVARGYRHAQELAAIIRSHGGIAHADRSRYQVFGRNCVLVSG